MNNRRLGGVLGLSALLVASPVRAGKIEKSLLAYGVGNFPSGELARGFGFSYGGGVGIEVGPRPAKLRANIGISTSRGDILATYDQRFLREEIEGQIESLNLCTIDLGARLGGEEVYFLGGFSCINATQKFKAEKIGRTGYYQESRDGTNGKGFHVGGGVEIDPHLTAKKNLRAFIEGTYRRLNMSDNSRLTNSGISAGLRVTF